MADHLITGQHLALHVECGNGQCRKWWDKPGVADPDAHDWLVCPHCNFSAPSNVAREFAAALEAAVAEVYEPGEPEPVTGGFFLGAITDEMVERAARAWWAHEAGSDVAWADVIEPVRNGYRARAQEALAAALSEDGSTL